MTRQWKPGDVAYYDAAAPGAAALLLKAQDEAWTDVDRDYRDPDLSRLRPLVVIDPEDREQVERLTRTFYAVRRLGEPALAPDRIDNMQAALREFANPQPPKPDEPTGLGAVVEDAAGKCWLRDFERGALPWRPVETSRVNGRHAPNTNAPARASWGDITAVRVLSEGVTS